MQQISGHRMEIIADNTSYSGGAFFVGESSYSEELGITIASNGLGDEGYVLKTVNNNLFIVGGRRGALYGVYSLLEDYYGCRWFTADCTVIPSTNDLVLPQVNKKFVPTFKFRDNHYSEDIYNNNLALANKVNGMKQNLSGRYGGNTKYAGTPSWLALGHTFRELVPDQQYWAKDANGNTITTNGQLDLTNEGTYTMALASVRAWLAVTPDADVISVSQEDAIGYCECDNCKARVAYYGGKQSGLILEFVNRIANAIKADYPNVLVETFAYTYSENPPANIVAADNVQIRLCSFYQCTLHPYDETGCQFSKIFGRQVVAWSTKTQNLAIWDYNVNFSHYLKPQPNFQVLQKNMQFFAKNNVKGVLMQGHFTLEDRNGEFAQLRSYVLAKLMWDPYCDYQKAINEFTDAYYGAAGVKIREYMGTVYTNYGSGLTEPVLNMMDNPPEPSYFSDAMLTICENVLEDAYLLTGDDIVLKKRVEIARMPVKYVRLWQARTTQNYNTLKTQFQADCIRLGIGTLKEGETITTTLNNLPSRTK
jgi:hypothetical protein